MSSGTARAIRIFMLLVAAYSIPAAAWALQDAGSGSFALIDPDSRIRSGDPIFVIYRRADADGSVQLTGEFVRLTDGSITIAADALPSESVDLVSDAPARLSSGKFVVTIPAARVQRLDWQKPDSVVDGTLIGAVAGAGAGFAFAALNCHADDYLGRNCRSGRAFLTSAGVLGLMGAGIGVTIDGLVRPKFRTLYSAGVAGGARRSLQIRPIVSPKRQGVALNFSW